LILIIFYLIYLSFFIFTFQLGRILGYNGL
jgi:hypothetical protein